MKIFADQLTKASRSIVTTPVASPIHDSASSNAGRGTAPPLRHTENYSREANSNSGQVVGVLAAKGGCGASTLAVNLAVALSQIKSLATIIDANLQQPQIASMLQCKAQFSLFDVISRSPDIDLHLLEACAVRVAQHCFLLTPPVDLQLSLTRNLSDLSAALPVMRPLSPHWVIDLPRHLDRHLVTVIDQCDAIVLVFEPTLDGVAAAKRQLDVLRELDYQADKLVLAANRCGSRTKQVEKDLGRCFAGYTVVKLPNDFDLLQSCLLSAEPAMVVKPGSPYCKAVSSLAKAIAEQADE